MDVAALQILSNHPVHVTDPNGKKSPSAFIPFCQFGGNTSSMGVVIEKFPVPVCSGFQARILYDQLCYEVDLERYKSNYSNVETDLKSGLVLILDNNEDREITLDENVKSNDGEAIQYRHNWISGMDDSTEEDGDISIHLDTIGKNTSTLYYKNIIRICLINFRTSCIERRGLV